jgi:hypothetical protein
MIQTAAPGLTVIRLANTRKGPPRASGPLSRALAALRLWRETFVEAQQMRRDAGARFPFIDS